MIFPRFFELEFVKCASLLSLTWIIMHIWKVFYLNPKLQVLKVLINLTFTDWQLGMFQSLHIQILWLQKCANMNWSHWKQTHATCKIGLIDGLGLQNMIWRKNVFAKITWRWFHDLLCDNANQMIEQKRNSHLKNQFANLMDRSDFLRTLVTRYLTVHHFDGIKICHM